MKLWILRMPIYLILLPLSFFSTEAQAQNTDKPVSGYSMGKKSLKRSPVSIKDFDSLKKSVLFSADDEKYLRMSHDILKDQTEQILDVWYGFVGGTPELAYYFGHPKTGKLDKKYLAAVRERFKLWILDTARADYDQAWLDYQHEIGLRHNKKKKNKNKTDRVKSVKQIHFRYIPALVYPITTTLKPFLAKKGHSKDDV